MLAEKIFLNTTISTNILDIDGFHSDVIKL